MKEVKYIPGDLVMIDNDVCQVKGVRKRNGLIQNVVEAKVISHTENIVRAVDESSITPIPLTPAILEANGWEISIVKDKRFWDRVSTEENVQKDSFVDKSIARIAVKNKIALMFMGSSPNVFIFELSHMVVRFEYCHQLQHLLFGLGLNSELKV